jgi:hypothetical protein
MKFEELSNIEEISHIKLTYETCIGGQAHEFIYVVTSEEWGCDNEALIGFRLLNDGHGFRRFERRPIQVTFDGLAYVNRIEGEKVIEIIGLELFKWHNIRMRAIEVLLNSYLDKPVGKCTNCGSMIRGLERLPEHGLCEDCFESNLMLEDPIYY